jgi:hypothetical protein
MSMKPLSAVTGALLLTLLTLVLLAGCTSGAATATSTATQRVQTPSATSDPLPILQQRSLHLSALAAGEPCVVAPPKQVSPDLGDALGDGPIYLVGYGGADGITSVYKLREDGGWYYLKTLWAAPPDFHGLFLLRGHQIDGPNELRFSAVDTAPPDLQAVFSTDDAGSTQSGWLPWLHYMRVRAPGCYGVQVDGLNFSNVIRFQVVTTPQP